MVFYKIIKPSMDSALTRIDERIKHTQRRYSLKSEKGYLLEENEQKHLKEHLAEITFCAESNLKMRRNNDERIYRDYCQTSSG